MKKRLRKYNWHNLHSIIIKWKGLGQDSKLVTCHALYNQDEKIRSACWKLLLVNFIKPNDLAIALNCTEKDVVELIGWYQNCSKSVLTS
jgi:hypothetical protein